MCHHEPTSLKHGQIKLPDNNAIPVAGSVVTDNGGLLECYALDRLVQKDEKTYVRTDICTL